jgi:hypothetical protein
MTLASKIVYITTSPEDNNTVWNDTKTISMNPIIMDMYIWDVLRIRVETQCWKRMRMRDTHRKIESLSTPRIDGCEIAS